MEGNDKVSPNSDLNKVVLPYRCPLCRKKVVQGYHSWMGDCSGCNKSINYCECKPKKARNVNDKNWKSKLVWHAIYRTGKFKFDDGCLDDDGLKLMKEIEEIYERG